MFDEKQNIENTSGTAVAIDEGMNRLELVVLHSQAHERVDVRRVVHEVGPVVELLDQEFLANGWRIDDFAGHAAFQCCPRFRTNIQLYTFDSTDYLNGHIDGQHAPLDHLRSFIERRAVAQCLLGRGVSFFGLQPIRRGLLCLAVSVSAERPIGATNRG